MNACEPVCACCGRDMALEIQELRDQLAEHRRYRTLGGPPRRPDEAWRNRVIEPVESARVAPWEAS